MRGAQVVLDVVDQRADADDLGTQRERGQEQPGERPCRRARRQDVEAFESWRPLAIRANASTCLRAARPAAPGLRERIASSSGTWSSAASWGSIDVP
jgi:hypothetical protein